MSIRVATCGARIRNRRHRQLVHGARNQASPLGQLLRAEDDEVEGASAVIVLSFDVWERGTRRIPVVSANQLC